MSERGSGSLGAASIGRLAPVTELTRWLRREAGRQSQRPDLSTALLTGRGFAYARHRLGFLGLRMLLRTGLHALEIYLLIVAFVPLEYLAPLISYRAACALVSAAHWGSLEALRSQVRAAMARRHPAAARAAVERWLGLALWASLLLVSATLLLEGASVWSLAAIELRDAYALACVLRLGMECSLRVLHSGVFALRRVYRPLWSILAGDLVEIATIIAGFNVLGVWTIPLATLCGGLADCALGWLYVHRAYLQRRLALPNGLRALRAVLRLRAPELRAAGQHALASGTLHLDALIMLLLLHAGSRPVQGLSFAVLYYVLRPLMAATTHWVRTFYFDIKLIEAGALRVFRPRLLRFLERLALGWSLLLGAVTLVCASWLFRGQVGPELLWLLPFFVVRSAFALWQIVAFGAGMYRALARVAAVVLVGLGVLGSLGLRDMPLLAAITAFLALVVARVRRQVPLLPEPERQGALDLGAWLARIRDAPSVQLGVAWAGGSSRGADALNPRVRGADALNPRVRGADALNPRVRGADALVRALQRAYPDLAITRWGRRHVLWAALGTSVLSRTELVVTSAGTLERLWLSAPLDANAALAQAHAAGALPEGLAEAMALHAPAPSLDALLQRFRADYASGVVCDLAGKQSGLTARPVIGRVSRALVSCIEARSRGHAARNERQVPFEIAVYAPEGQARVIFLADKPATGFDAFRAQVQRSSLYASWHSS